MFGGVVFMLNGVQHLVAGAPEQRPQLRRRNRVGMRDGLIQFAFVQAPHFPKHLLVYPVEHGPEVRRAMRGVRWYEYQTAGWAITSMGRSKK
jgi:hypothetical protein